MSQEFTRQRGIRDHLESTIGEMVERANGLGIRTNDIVKLRTQALAAMNSTLAPLEQDLALTFRHYENYLELLANFNAAEAALPTRPTKVIAAADQEDSSVIKVYVSYAADWHGLMEESRRVFGECLQALQDRDLMLYGSLTTAACRFANFEATLRRLLKEGKLVAV